jgi:hypothetical protein
LNIHIPNIIQPTSRSRDSESLRRNLIHEFANMMFLKVITRYIFTNKLDISFFSEPCSIIGQVCAYDMTLQKPIMEMHLFSMLFTSQSHLIDQRFFNVFLQFLGFNLHFWYPTDASSFIAIVKAFLPIFYKYSTSVTDHGFPLQLLHIYFGFFRDNSRQMDANVLTQSSNEFVQFLVFVFAFCPHYDSAYS